MWTRDSVFKTQLTKLTSQLLFVVLMNPSPGAAPPTTLASDY